MQNHFAYSEPQYDAEWLEGQIVAAQFSQDDFFYRAQVVNVQEDGHVKVVFLLMLAFHLISVRWRN